MLINIPYMEHVGMENEWITIESNMITPKNWQVYGSTMGL
jgi:hypothetical protein